MMANANIVLVTTGQPSVNPRLVKEADSLCAAGYKVTVLYCYWIKWAMAADVELLKRVKWDHQLAGGTPADKKWTYLYTRLRLKVNLFFNRVFGNKMLFGERSQARCYDELLQAARSIKADWYIGHNLGALPVVAKAAKYNNAKCGFDFEDYHREETNSFDLHKLKKIIHIENHYAPKLGYISTASPMITEKVKQNFPLLANKVFTILNCFPVSQQPSFRNRLQKDITLQLFWFSQTVGTNRGLEQLFSVLQKINDNSIHLTLAGNCSSDVKEFVEVHASAVKKNIHFAGIIEPANLATFAAGFDVGLAIELCEPNNRNICLSNKLFTYLLGGNAIILSATLAQKKFNKEYNVGQLFTAGNVSELEATVIFYRENMDKLNSQRKHNYTLAANILNWEHESAKFLSLIN